MLDYDALWQRLGDLGLGSWRPQLEDTIRSRFSARSHGDFPRWKKTIAQLRAIDENEHQEIRDLLLSLAPWRKGPFEIAGINIDSEWQSNLKWDRLNDAIAPLDDRMVLDVGCGNGYYALRMQELGARTIIGIDPTLLYVVQFLAVQRFRQVDNVFVLPLRLHELPGKCRSFDTCFSMGVLYHQRYPLPHLEELKATLRPGGELVLETLFLPDDESTGPRPQDRYARMKNVGSLPTITKLKDWLGMTGFGDIRIVDKSITTIDEQRTTEWMTFESLAEALDPADPTRTIEGWPAPRRIIVLANAR
ncbi:MAG: tRNA 5-methoxyuridine(34)/uridine 5-oxyacetic acid(34) synthase CmoB [Proteobacteria bacterium]|nr:tRNA 5-methoxyuridine(34)/uridine 5-oxyacetic acid(34) synthase CmoB [Pseudomonadota bacterium]